MALKKTFCVGVMSIGEALALAASARAIYEVVKLYEKWGDLAMESAEEEEEEEEEARGGYVKIVCKKGAR